MPSIDANTWTIIKDGSSATVLFAFLIFFSRAYLKNTAKIAEEVTFSTAQHIQALTKVTDALTALTIQVARNTDVVVRCKKIEREEESKHE